MALEAQEILDLNIVSSEELRKWVIQRGGDPDRTVTCYTNIDTYRWCPDRETRERVRRDMRIGEDTAAILYGGRICEQKQPAVFARTMLLLKERGLPFFAIIAGDGPDHKWLVEFLKKNKLLDKTRILGEVSIQRMKELMEAADILFLPSKWEGISLMIYEAMACGLPIVSADVGGQRELVTSDCGFLISPSNQETDSKRYAEKLALLAKNARLRVRMGISSRDRVSTHFGLARMGENMIKILARAKNLHDTVPRPVKSLALGRESAALALKYFRSFNIPDEVFDKYNSTNWRLKTYFKVKFLFEPLYQWGLKRGWTWLFPIGEKIKKFLTGSA